jgi:hypothetical protein
VTPVDAPVPRDGEGLRACARVFPQRVATAFTRTRCVA